MFIDQRVGKRNIFVECKFQFIPKAIRKGIKLKKLVNQFNVSDPYVFIYRQQIITEDFDDQVLRRDVNSELLKINLNNADLSQFTEIFLSILDKYA